MEATFENIAHWSQKLRDLYVLYPLPPGLPANVLEIIDGDILGSGESPLDPYASICLGFLVSSEANAIPRRTQDFEFLLDHAANLLERALDTKHKWQDKATSAFAFVVALTEFGLKSEVLQKMATDNYYGADSDLASAELESNQQLKDAAERAGYLAVHNEVDLSPDPVAPGHPETSGLKLVRLSGDQAYLAPWPIGVEEMARLHWLSTRGVDGGFEGVANGNKPPVAGNIAKELATLTAESQANSWTARRIDSDAQFASKADLAPGLASKALWEGKNKQYKFLLDQVSVAVNQLRASAFGQQNGAINLHEQMKVLRDQFSKDLEEALLCCFLADSGLRQYLPSAAEWPALPVSVLGVLPQALTHRAQIPATSDDCFDEAVAWVRHAINLVVSHNAGSEQSFFVVGNGNPQLVAGQTSLELTVNLLEAVVPNLSGKRMRGISVFVETRSGRSTAVEVHKDGQPKSGMLGQCMGRASQRDPEFGCVKAFWNLPAFGSWNFKLSRLGQTANDLANDVLSIEVVFGVID